ncbi:protein Cep78 homolog isoform X2 [Neodiprion fabricii]|uniref:protein Cep78 homolog isoform X2 n=1 Tax=Neodiprion fabricii TaxID=2872261 RepID=UPI001ED8FE21|nr:protein Cep78 homolog isoform X2 [Neodiprion fabricii]
MSKSISYPSFNRTYELMCKEDHVQPLPAIKSHLRKGRLRLCADRINFEDWSPVLHTIANDRSLFEIIVYSRHRRKKIREQVNNAERIEKFRRRLRSREPMLYTNFILRCFVDAISSCIGKSPVITSLTLDGIPLPTKYLGPLCEGLKCAKNLTALRLPRCRIGDTGCDLVLNVLVDCVSLCILDLSSCRLTIRSSMSLSTFLKKRRTNLLHSAWSDAQAVQGLHTLVLNHNRKLGDCGVRLLVDELKEDFWMKTFNIRHCGLTSRGGETVVRLLETNSVVTSIDLKENDIPETIIHNMSKILRRRKENGERASMRKRLITAKEMNFQGNKDDRKKPTTRMTDLLLKKKSHFVSTLNKNLTKNQRSWTRLFIKSSTRRIPGWKVTHPRFRRPKNTERENFDLKKLSARLSRTIGSNAVLLRELINDRELLGEVKTRRLEAEKKFSELEPQLEKLRKSICEQDKLRYRISQERNLFDYLKRLFARLEEFPESVAVVSNPEDESTGAEEIIGGNPAWKIVSEVDLSPEGRNLRANYASQRGRPHCPRKLRGQ